MKAAHGARGTTEKVGPDGTAIPLERLEVSHINTRRAGDGRIPR